MEWHNFYSESPKMVLGLTVGAGLLIYYLVEAVKRPVLACRGGRWRSFLEARLGILQERYWPTPWCYEARCQTILASVLRASLPDIPYAREMLELKDGGQVCLDWLVDGYGGAGDSHPIVIILPGLTGSSQSEYVKGFVLSVRDAGARCVVFNHRGRGGVQLKTARTYCAANSDDLEEAIEHIRRKYPTAPLMATGISLGGMILGNYLVTRGKQAADHLVAAMVLSIPWNVFVGTESLEKPLWNLMLNRHLAHCLCESIRSMRKQLEGNYSWDLDHVMQSKTIREFDARFTARQFGYRDVEEYYRSACLHDKLHLIRVPLLCLSAADDPFQPLQGIPMEEANKSSHVAIVVTSRGGHIGFMEGILPTNTYYSDRLYRQLVQGVFSDLDSMKEVQFEADQYVERMAQGGRDPEIVQGLEKVAQSSKFTEKVAQSSKITEEMMLMKRKAQGGLESRMTQASERMAPISRIAEQSSMIADKVAQNLEIREKVAQSLEITGKVAQNLEILEKVALAEEMEQSVLDSKIVQGMKKVVPNLEINEKKAVNSEVAEKMERNMADTEMAQYVDEAKTVQNSENIEVAENLGNIDMIAKNVENTEKVVQHSEIAANISRSMENAEVSVQNLKEFKS